MRIHSHESEILFRTDNEMCMCLVDCIQSAIINVAAIHHVRRARFYWQHIEDLHIMHGSFGNMHKCGDAPAEIKECMELHRTFRFSKERPLKHGQAQINRRRIERIERATDLFQERSVGTIQGACFLDENVTECFVDSPIALFVRVRQRGPSDRSTQSEMIQLRWVCVETKDNTPETLAERQLSETETQKLLPTGERFDGMIAVMTYDTRLESISG